MNRITMEPVEIIRPAVSRTGTLEELGVPVHNSTSHAAAFAKSGEGRTTMYLSLDGSQGEDARLGIVDLDEERLIEAIRLPDAMGGFTMTVANDRSVYVASHNKGNVYRYTPEDGKLDTLGKPTPETTFGYSLIPVGDDSVFGGTYPGAAFYEYRPGRGFKIHGPHPFEPGEHYVRSLAHWPEAGVTYVGIGSHPRLKRYEHATGQIRELLPETYRNDEFVYDLNIEGGSLFVRLNPSNRMLVYRLASDSRGLIAEELVREVPNVGSLGVSEEYDGSIYYVSSAGSLHRYDIRTGEAVSLGIDTTIAPFKLSFVQLADQASFPGRTLIGVGCRMGKTRLFKYNPAKGTIRITDLDIPGVPTNVQCVVAGLDGQIYAGAFLVGGTSVYDPSTGLFTEHKGVGQIENMVEVGGKMYFSVYPYAKLFEYDPTQPWTMANGGSNPRLLFNLSAEEQDRPYGLTAGGGVLYIGTICGYGKLGGAITVFDPRSGTRKVYRNPLPDLSIVSLVHRGGKLYGGTNVWGGLGIKPARTEAELLVFDTCSEEARGIPMPVPGLKAITALTFGTDGLLWSMAEGYVFAFDPVEESYVYLAHLFPDILYGEHSIWRDASLQFARDGALYGTVKGKYLFRYEPGTASLETLVEDGARFLAEDREGRLYFSDGKTRLRRYTLLD
ncbi:hypothetical protein PV433_18660 [Paenibacillus sp. GYB004]|uniref:hypothetical protein n=1 Tax=Paenibacillus sp. GYB004 TaxID=2994393 RepID=UPI002F969CC1